MGLAHGHTVGPCISDVPWRLDQCRSQGRPLRSPRSDLLIVLRPEPQEAWPTGSRGANGGLTRAWLSSFFVVQAPLVLNRLQVRLLCAWSPREKSAARSPEPAQEDSDDFRKP